MTKEKDNERLAGLRKQPECPNCHRAVVVPAKQDNHPRYGTCSGCGQKFFVRRGVSRI